jgi:predicted RNA binding protein YcfA (HicA-like mRNA interferase family)
MPKLPGINHLKAIKAFEKAGFRLLKRRGKNHAVMSDGLKIIIIPRHNPINAFTMGSIIKDAGLTIEQFKNLLS